MIVKFCFAICSKCKHKGGTPKVSAHLDFKCDSKTDF